MVIGLNEEELKEQDAAVPEGEAVPSTITTTASESVAAPSKATSPTGVKDLVIVGILSLIVGCALCVPFFLGSGSSADKPGSDTTAAGHPSASASSAASYTDADYRAGRDVQIVDLYDTSEGVVAQVEDKAIGSAAVERYMQAFKKASSDVPYADDELRQMVVDYFIEFELLRQAGAENGVEVAEDEVRQSLAQVRSQFDSQSEFEAYLAGFGMDEGAFALAVESDLLAERLVSVVVGDITVSDAEVVAALRPEVNGADAAAVASAFAELPEAERESTRLQLADQARSAAFAQWFYERAGKARVERFD